MKKIHLHIDKQANCKKPTNAGTITKRIVDTVSEVTPVELAQLVGQEGRTVVLSTMKGERKQNNIIQQQALALDFDNKDENGKKTSGMFYHTIEEAIKDPFIRKNAAFIYKTFSYEENHEKFRVVFILDKPLTKLEEVKSAYKWLGEKYVNADKAPTSPASLFYGGKGVTVINFENQLPAASIPMTVASKVSNKQKTVALKATKHIAIQIPTWLLMQQGNKEQVAARLSVYTTRLHGKVQAINYLKSINMMDLLDVHEDSFSDLFHEDKNPSAGIFKMQEADIYLYKCHSSNYPFTGDIIQVVSKLTGLNFMDALNYLIEVTDIKIEMTEQIHDLLEQCSIFQNTLLSTDLKESYPAIHNKFWRYKTEVNAILDIFKENIYEDATGELRSLTWMSSENLAIKLFGSKSKAKTIRRILDLMSYTNWIDKLDDSQIPEELLKKIKKNQNQNGYQRRSSVFEMLNLSSDFFKQLNKRCEVMIKQGHTMKGMSKEYVLNTDGKQTADRVYSQEKHRGISKTSKDINEDIYKLIEFHLLEETHVVVVDLLDELTAKWKSRNLVETKFKQVLPKLLRDKNLQKSRLTKELRQKWNLPSTQSSPVILYAA